MAGVSLLLLAEWNQYSNRSRMMYLASAWQRGSIQGVSFPASGVWLYDCMIPRRMAAKAIPQYGGFTMAICFSELPLHI